MVLNHTVTVTYGKGFNFLPAVPLREKVERLQNALLEMPQADIVTKHDFEPGKYIRTMIAPPWSVIVGAEHTSPYKVRLEKGTIAVNIDDNIKIVKKRTSIRSPEDGIYYTKIIFDIKENDIQKILKKHSKKFNNVVPAGSPKEFHISSTGVGNTEESAKLQLIKNGKLNNHITYLL
jgi:hypothetical protein